VQALGKAKFWWGMQVDARVPFLGELVSVCLDQRREREREKEEERGDAVEANRAPFHC
jgi:hypothetical protein